MANAMLRRLLRMVADMTEDENLQKRLDDRSKTVDIALKLLDDKELKHFRELLRTYVFVYEKWKQNKRYLKNLNIILENNQKSFLMQVITSEKYKSNQDYCEKIALEMKQEFYEFELEKIGISYVPYQKEYELIEDYLNKDLPDDEKLKNQLVCDLYGVSLQIKVLQRIGCSFV